MTSLESIVLPLAESRALVEKGIVLDTALAWYHQHCDVYEGETPEGMSLEDWEIVQGRPVVCVRREMEDHKPICPAPVFSELLDAIDPAESSTEKMIALSRALIALCEEVKP